MTYLTNDIYWDSKPDAYQPLRAMVGGGAERQALAAHLHDQGYLIDWAIDINGWDAGLVMAIRLHDGDKVVPDKWQNLPGTIKVSIDAADYPPAHPAPTPPPPTTNPVGAQSPTPGVYTWTPAAFDGHGNPVFKEGDSVTAPDGNVVTFHIYQAPPFAMTGWEWETASAKAARLAAEGTAVTQ